MIVLNLGRNQGNEIPLGNNQSIDVHLSFRLLVSSHTFRGKANRIRAFKC